MSHLRKAAFNLEIIFEKAAYVMYILQIISCA